MRPSPSRHWWKRIGWLAVIWLASVAGLTAVAYALKLLMRSAGMTT
ncbi:DUF2474 domain-containing protein [Lysobacter sp. CW239]|jgi:hypothetical protein|nr:MULTISPECIES: DUF2474 domain-containing protein [Lysobacter]QOD90153.1 DUF2474 domain-containing protein [Lysobacter sp. CW239]